MRKFLSKKILASWICTYLLSTNLAQGQGRINFGNSYMVFTGATASNPIYLSIDNGNANAIIASSSGHAISSNEFQRIRWRIGANTGNYVFPFGAKHGSSIFYAPFTANITTQGVGTSGYFDVSTWYAPGHTPLPVGGYSICPGAQVILRFWRIEPTDYSTTPTADIRFYYIDHSGPIELNSIPEAKLKAQRGDLSLTPCPWHPPTGTANTTDNYVQVNGVSTFSPWTLTHEEFPLPVTLIDFSARWLSERDPQAAIIEWKTAAEHNNAYFEIERSANGIQFAKLARVPAMNHQPFPRYYSYVDEHPLPFKQSYYRLRQVDQDGSESYSQIVALQREQALSALRIYPNPTRERISFEYASSYDGNLRVEVIDNLGRLVYSGIPRAINNNTYAVDVERLAAGSYVLKVISPADVQISKFVVE